ncbi:MAG TPA: hypothetical protein VGH34_07135 [Vicinamibacterales bacterium]
MRRLLCLPLVAMLAAILAAVPATASAVTLDQVVALAHAGVTDTVILALIDRDKTIFAIEPEQIVALQRDGVSEAVVLAMLKSGREEGEQAARAISAYNSATIAAAIAPGPEMVVVGHGPEVPNTAHVDGFYSGPPASGYYYAAIPYAYPSFRNRSVPPRRTAAQLPGVRPLCIAQSTTGRSAGSFSTVAGCPGAMPRAPR